MNLSTHPPVLLVYACNYPFISLSVLSSFYQHHFLSIHVSNHQQLQRKWLNKKGGSVSTERDSASSLATSHGISLQQYCYIMYICFFLSLKDDKAKWQDGRILTRLVGGLKTSVINHHKYHRYPEVRYCMLLLSAAKIDCTYLWFSAILSYLKTI